MKNTITTIILGIFLISLASAMYPGECKNITFPNVDDVNITITGNSSNMDGFTWNKTGTIIEYCFAYNYAPDNFTLTWYNYQSVEESVSSSSSGSSGGGSAGYSYQENIQNGYTKKVRIGEVVSFKINNSKHTLVVNKLSDTSATFKIQSSPSFVTLLVGEERKLNLDSEGYYDFSILLNSIQDKKADITIKELFEGVKVEVDDDEETQEETEEVDEKERTLLKWKIVLVFFLILLIIMISFIIRKYINKN